jgi:glutathione S-transferase
LTALRQKSLCANVEMMAAAYTLDWANEVQLLDGFPPLRAYMERMYARPHAPLRIAETFARMKAGQA